jgi:hypothetical protein
MSADRSNPNSGSEAFLQAQSPRGFNCWPMLLLQVVVVVRVPKYQQGCISPQDKEEDNADVEQWQ